MNKALLKKISTVFTIVFGIWLVPGCNSDNSNTNSIENFSNPGLYVGEFVNDTFGAQSQVYAILTNDNNIRLMFWSLAGQAVGEFTASGNSLEGSLALFQSHYINFFHALSESLEFEANIVNNNQINGTWSDGTSTGRIYLTKYSAGQAANLPVAEATWVVNLGSSSGGIFTLTLTIDSNGRITGSDTNGCVFNGNLIGSDSDGEIEFEITNCGTFNGQYNGLAITISTSTNNSLLLLASSNQFSFTSELNR